MGLRACVWGGGGGAAGYAQRVDLYEDHGDQVSPSRRLKGAHQQEP